MNYFQIFVLIYFLCINSIYTFLTFIAYFEVKRQKKRSYINDYNYLYNSKLAPGLSLIISAFNEELTIVDSIKSYLKTRYRTFEVVLVNDGSTDNTLQVIKDNFDLVETKQVLHTAIKTKNVHAAYRSKTDPRLIVIDKKAGGKKADGSNCAINAAKYPYLLNLDADVILEKDAVLKVMKAVMDDQEKNIAVGGIVRIINGSDEKDGELTKIHLSHNPLVNFQIVEYFRAFNAGRTGFSKLKTLLIVSGAFHVFNMEAVRKAGGYSTDTVTEDMEMLIRMHRKYIDAKQPYNVVYLPYPVCWTEAPENLKILGNQRNRWHRGLCEILTQQKNMIFNPKYGRIGLFGLPFFFLFEFLGPLVEITGYGYFFYVIINGVVNWQFFWWFMLLAINWGVLLSVSAILYEDLNFNWYKKTHQIMRLFFYAVLENFGYRQITVFWRIHGFFDFLIGKKGWGEMTRKGFQKTNDKP